MDYRLEPRRIGSRRRAAFRIAGVAFVATGVLAAGWLGGAGREPGGQASPAPIIVVRTAAPLPVVGRPWRLDGPDPTLPAPRDLDCTTVPPSECAAAIRAARSVVVSLGAHPVAAIVHASLVCGSHRDCPRSLIAGSEALGSVVIRFDDGRETWVNVVRPRANRHGQDVPPEARVVHWTSWSG